MSEPIQPATIIKREGIMLLLGLLAQWPIWWASAMAARVCNQLWSVGLGDPVLPVLTQLSISVLPWVAPIAIVALVVVFVVGCALKSSPMVLRGLFLTMMVEACFLALFALGLIVPGASMTLYLSP